jgi:4-amino-4-deoxy-L-arabinose transferase-like glycosyltransferase
MTRPTLDRHIAGWRGPVLAALLTLLAGLPSLLLLPPLDREESRFAQASSQMLESDDYVDTRFQAEPLWRTPIGIYWMQAAAVATTSSVEARDIAPYRLPSLIGAMLAALACAWAGSALFGQRAGFLAGAALGTCFLLSTEAGIAKTDAMLCGAVTLSMAALARIYMATKAGERPQRPHKFAFWFGLGLSILVKGPAGLVVVAPAMVALSVWDRDIRWMKRLGWGWGLPLVALILGPWALAITIATDGAFWHEALSHGLAGRAAATVPGPGGFPGIHTVLAPLLLFPATLLLPAALSTGWRRRAEPGVRFLICWLVPAWLIFEIAPTRLWDYTLPTFGAVALLIGAAATQPVGVISRRIGAGLAVLTAVVISAITLYALTRFGTSTAQTWATVTLVCTLAAGFGGALILLKRATIAALLASIVFGSMAHAALAGTLRGLKPLSVSTQLEQALNRAGLAPDQGLTPGPVAITTFHEPSFVFLTGQDTELTNAAGAAKALSEGRPAIVEAGDAKAFDQAMAATGTVGRAVTTVRGHNYSTGSDVTLTIYAPRRPPAGPSEEPGQ